MAKPAPDPQALLATYCDRLFDALEDIEAAGGRLSELKALRQNPANRRPSGRA